jgi:hypothetical protein
MARPTELDPSQPPARPRLSILPDDTEDTVVITLDWLQEITQTLEGCEEAFDLILNTIKERDRLYKNLQTQTQAHEAQVLALVMDKEELSQELLQALRTTTPAREASPQTTAQKSTKLPDPPIFTGDSDPAIDDWLSKMRSKLKANSDHYPTPDLQMGYVENRVGGTAIKHLAPRLRSGSVNPFKSAEEMLEVLERIFADPNRRMTALQEFRKLYQGNKDFNSFWAEFQRLAAEIDYSPETLIDELRNKVSAELERAIITETDPVDVYALARKCQLYDQNIQKVKAREARFQDKSRSARTMPARQPISPAPASAPASVPAPAKPPTTSNALTVYTGPRNSQPRTPLTEEERQRLRAENGCFYCRNLGHRAAECPAKARTGMLTTVNLLEDQDSQGKASP